MAAAVLAAAAVLIVIRLGQNSGTPNAQPSTDAVDSIASSERTYAMAATTRLDTASFTALPAEKAGELLVTRTWTSVRKSRSKVADLEAVLLPGDSVVADSLERGWYRVALEGEVIGYAHRSTLTAPGRLTDKVVR